MDETKRYHNKIYSNKKIYEEGSWLKEPEAMILDLLKHFEGKKKLNILDLCSGIGRNSIRMAELLKGSGSRITCVDMLDTAIEKLKTYIHDFKVEEIITPVKSDVMSFEIKENAYDYIITWSCIEHLDSLSKFNNMLEKIQKGTRSGGINCLMINSDVTEYDIEEGISREALIELNFKKGQLNNLLKKLYNDWEILSLKNESYIDHLERYGRKYIFKSYPLIMAVKKN